jgi:hypothetical protein
MLNQHKHWTGGIGGHGTDAQVMPYTQLHLAPLQIKSPCCGQGVELCRHCPARHVEQANRPMLASCIGAAAVRVLVLESCRRL